MIPTAETVMTWTREECIAWLQWNDGNGLWSDEDLASEELRPMTVAEARAWVLYFASESDPTAAPMLARIASEHGFTVGDNGPELSL